MSSKQEICYWCGAPSSSREHVPPHSFYTADYQGSRITVPSCKTHNEDFHQLDERFRIYLQGTSSSETARKAFADKTIRGLKRSHGLSKTLVARSSPARLQGKHTLALNIPESDHDPFFEKINRALYYYHHHTPFKGDISSVCSHILHQGIDFKKIILVYRENEKSFVPGVTTDDRIFRYEFSHLIDRDGEAFVTRMTFYEDITVFGYAVKANEP